MTQVAPTTQSNVTDINQEQFEILLHREELFNVSARIAELRPEFVQDLECDSDLVACLPPLLALMRWHGDKSQFFELLPSDANRFDITDLRNLLARLGYRTDLCEARFRDADASDGPVVFVPRHEQARVVYDRMEHDDDIATLVGPVVEDCAPSTRGYILSVHELTHEERPDPDASWFWSNLAPLRAMFAKATALTAVSNLMAVAPPLFIMAVYDRVLPSASYDTLYNLVIGILIAFAIDHFARTIRSTYLQYASARISSVAGNGVFERLLNLPTRLTERASLNAQVSRIRDVEKARELLTGPLAQAVMNLPFVLIFFGVIYAVGGNLVLIPMVTMVMFGLAALVLMHVINRRVTEAAQASGARQELVLESIQKMRSLRVSGSEQIWLDRFDQVAGDAVRANYRHSQAVASVSTVSNFLAVTTGLAILGFGVGEVLSGAITMGGLIATMLLSWRIIAPLQNAFLGLTRFEQLRSSIRQIDSLMRNAPERAKHAPRPEIEEFAGSVAFESVSFRYGVNAGPALVNVNFAVEPGESVAVLGRNGSGKSSVLKLIAGLYDPQIGRVLIDGRDMRQLDRIALRRSISYVTQVPHVYQGTIAENLRLAKPGASDEELWNALAEAGAESDFRSLPDGLETMIDTRTPRQIHSSMIIKLSLARAFLKRSPIVLFDEPINGLDFEGEFNFLSALERLKGHSTVFIVTHRPGHVGAVDKVVEFERGTVRFFGTREKYTAMSSRQAA